jgi:hypothetical protein
MMNGRVGAIRRALDREGHTHVSIMSYTATFFLISTRIKMLLTLLHCYPCRHDGRPLVPSVAHSIARATRSRSY